MYKEELLDRLVKTEKQLELFKKEELEMNRIVVTAKTVNDEILFKFYKNNKFKTWLLMPFAESHLMDKEVKEKIEWLNQLD